MGLIIQKLRFTSIALGLGYLPSPLPGEAITAAYPSYHPEAWLGSGVPGFPVAQDYLVTKL